jgi:hypothetical protein
MSIRLLQACSANVLDELLNSGFLVLHNFLSTEQLSKLTKEYDLAVSNARPSDIRTGSTTTRVSNIVNYSAEFDDLYTYGLILEASHRVVGHPFKLSTLHARSVRPNSPPQPLHVDFRANKGGWPMLGFIFMIDDFRSDNGATRFVADSHQWAHVPGEIMTDTTSDHDSQVIACGAAGSLILYNGSIWHGHTANRTAEPRRSIQGAYIRA